MSDEVFDQIMKIRDSGETNMLAVDVVQRMAFERGYNELVIFIEENRREYVNFILTGER
jgi:hypothetical protein